MRQLHTRRKVCSNRQTCYPISEETGVAFVPHQSWEAVTRKHFSNLEGVFSTCPEKTIRDMMVVNHNKIACLVSAIWDLKHGS